MFDFFVKTGIGDQGANHDTSIDREVDPVIIIALDATRVAAEVGHGIHVVMTVGGQGRLIKIGRNQVSLVFYLRVGLIKKLRTVNIVIAVVNSIQELLFSWYNSVLFTSRYSCEHFMHQD